jgi:hypothetical protein
MTRDLARRVREAGRDLERHHDPHHRRRRLPQQPTTGVALAVGGGHGAGRHDAEQRQVAQDITTQLLQAPAVTGRPGRPGQRVDPVQDPDDPLGRATTVNVPIPSSTSRP